MSKTLNIFIDESGDFGEYDYRSPYYMVGMVLHDIFWATQTKKPDEHLKVNIDEDRNHELLELLDIKLR